MYTDRQLDDAELTAKLPKPVGYHILIAIPDMSDKTEGGVYMPDALVKAEETATIIGYGKEFRLINDDSVEATVADPRGYSRV